MDGEIKWGKKNIGEKQKMANEELGLWKLEGLELLVKQRGERP